MNDGSIRCAHGGLAHLVKRPDLGPGWVQPIADKCILCDADPHTKKIPYQPGNWQEIAAKEAADAAADAEGVT